MENTRFGCSRARRINRLQSVRSRFLGLVLCSALASSFTTGPSLAAVPTNDADAFRRLDLYLDRTAFQGTNDHVNITQYPGFLDSPQLIAVRGPADTVCLIRSTPYDGMNMSVTNTVPQSFTEYAINPPQYLTSVAVILMNFNTFNGSGAFNDAGKTVARVVVRYVDATTATSNVQVGLHTRDWAAGSVFCPGTVPFYTAQPSSPLMGVLWPAGAPNYFRHQRVPASGEQAEREGRPRSSGGGDPGPLLQHLRPAHLLRRSTARPFAMAEIHRAQCPGTTCGAAIASHGRRPWRLSLRKHSCRHAQDHRYHRM